MYRVALPAVIATYTYHRNNTSQITDSPTIRSLNFCLNDDLEEWVEAEMTIQSLITSGDDACGAADHQAELATLLLAAGGIVGSGLVGSFDMEAD